MKPHLLIPMAGRGQRFVDAGFAAPKPLIMAGDRHILDWSMDSICLDEYASVTFVVQKDHVTNFGIDQVLRHKYGNDVNIVVLERVTRGTVESCLMASQFINRAAPLVIFTLDVFFRPKFSYQSVPDGSDGLILTFKANNPAYSYSEIQDGQIRRVVEKEVISPWANCGIYTFRTGNIFLMAAHDMIQKNLTTRGEFFVAPLYQQLIDEGKKICAAHVEKMHLMGTPDELDFFVNKTLPKFGDKPVALCCDHSGIELKDRAKSILREFGIEHVDFGTYQNQDCDYPDFVKLAAKHILSGQSDFALGFCRTGQGVNIAANKIAGIRGALIFDDYTCEHSRRHNCANFFAIPSKYINPNKLRDFIKILCAARFDGGRHCSRIMSAEAK